MKSQQQPRKLLLNVDFDGTLSSYLSGWKGPRNIPDPALPGAMAFLIESLEHFEVAVFSSRSRYWFGRHAMKRWLREQMYDYLKESYSELPTKLKDEISEKFWMATEQDDQHRWAARMIVAKIQFPLHKPPAHITIDDRAFRFQGHFPSPGEIVAFTPWRLFSNADLDEWAKKVRRGGIQARKPSDIVLTPGKFPSY